MGATVTTVKIDVLSRRARRAKAAAEELISALAEVPEANDEQRKLLSAVLG
ncbi:hypothetical protein ABIA35_008035 [Catenulispora sp. MAP12-49]|uniref:hypothetical protein n=1 Tax=Catenulispora sp. MAP12-49 TaxID=3156302 RepID=UPI003517C93A